MSDAVALDNHQWTTVARARGPLLSLASGVVYGFVKLTPSTGPFQHPAVNIQAGPLLYTSVLVIAYMYPGKTDYRTARVHALVSPVYSRHNAITSDGGGVLRERVAEK